MLSATAWVIVGPSEVPIDRKVFLRREDADLALDVAKNSPAWAQFAEVLGVRERTLVVAFGFTDAKLQLVPQGELDLDGLVDQKGVEYIGKAVQQPDGTWICLANVNGALCRVQVTVHPQEINTALTKDDLHECAECSAKPGSPTLCARCLRARKAAGNLWKGPRRRSDSAV